MKLKIRGDLELQIVDEPGPRFVFDVAMAGITVKDIEMLILPNDQKCNALVTPVDAQGNLAPIEGVPAWSSSNIAIVTVSPLNPDGSGTFSAEVVPDAELGTAQINVQADADLGAGVQTITGVLDIQIVAGAAVGFQISTSPPVPIS